uniref:Uncharacterized protein n=1 Tax=Helianthus annuus TaxID=4232 RepID=A0A251UKT5_HELAN
MEVFKDDEEESLGTKRTCDNIGRCFVSIKYSYKDGESEYFDCCSDVSNNNLCGNW